MRVRNLRAAVALVGLFASLVACTSAHAPRPAARRTAAAAPAVEVPFDTVAYEGAFPAITGRTHVTLTLGGVERGVALVVPERRAARPPLVLMLHGTRAHGGDVIDECGALGLANAQGVIVAAPDARVMPTADWDHAEQANERWWETADDHDPDHNADLLLVRATITAARRAYGVDPSRVYVMGHSNGAFFALVVSMRLGDRLAGVAFNSGGLVRCASTGRCGFRAGRALGCAQYPAMAGWCGCDGPALPMEVSRVGRRFPVVISHGTDDPDVSVQYACSLDAALRAQGFPVTLQLRPGDGHFCDGDFAEYAWGVLTASRPAAP